MRIRMRMKKKKSQFYCIKTESRKIINSLEKTTDNKDLLKKESIRKKITIITKKLRQRNINHINHYHYKP